MRIHSESIIHHPREAVFTAYRDKLPEVAAYIPDIRAIDVVSREDGQGTAKLHNLWIADREVPGFAKAFIKPDMMCWDDHADWSDAEQLVRWELHVRAFSEAVTCKGTNSFHVVDDQTTQVLLEGELQIDLAKVRGVPRIMAGRLGPKFERFIVSLITPNLEKVNESLGAYLDDRG
jgi:hypothetical protein